MPAIMYPKNNDIIIKMLRETGEDTHQHSPIIIENITKAIIIVNIPIIENLINSFNQNFLVLFEYYYLFVQFHNSPQHT